MVRVIPILLFLLAASQLFSQPSQLLSRSIKSISESERARAVSFSRIAVTANDYYDIKYYRCEWTLDPAERFISGSVTLVFNTLTDTDIITVDFSDQLIVDSSIYHEKTTVNSKNNSNILTIRLPQKLNAGTRDSVSIIYHGIPPAGNSFVTRQIQSAPVLWTLSEPYGAKDWWPCKNNPSDKADSIDIILRFPAKYRSSSNGLLVSESVNGQQKIAHWKHRYPISSYLVAVAIADYILTSDTVLIDGKRLPLNNYTYASSPGLLVEPMRIAKVYGEKFSAVFGAYPFLNETYSQTQFGAGGGMEHQTNSFLTSGNGLTAAHELGHQWFGDKVTCASWRDIWLNEGFASYLEYLVIEYQDPGYTPVYRNSNRQIVTEEPGGCLRVDDTTDFNRIFNFRLSYSKGMGVIHMIRLRLGYSLFFAALRNYLNDPKLAYSVATTDDLRRKLEETSGQNFAEFFRDWYEGQGFPGYQLTWSINNSNWVKIRLNQTSSHPSVSFFEMPVPVKLSGRGRDTTIILDHRFNGQEYQLQPGFVPDTMLIDPDIWLISANNSVRKDAVGNTGNNILKIFPNPSPEIVHVSIANPTGKHLTITVTNALGQKVFEQRASLTGRDELYSVNMSRFAKGMYWIRVSGNEFNSIKKIVK